MISVYFRSDNNNDINNIGNWSKNRNFVFLNLIILALFLELVDSMSIYNVNIALVLNFLKNNKNLYIVSF